MRVIIALCLTLIVFASLTGNDWPQWRGPDRSGISKETGLLQTWPKDGPALHWKAKDLGAGYSSPTISKGKVFLQTTRDDVEYALALDEKDGKQLWSTAIGKVGKNIGPPYPGTRSSLTVDGELVFGLASDGELTCLSTNDGSIKWQKHYRKDFEGKPGNWAFSESVLIDGDKLICTPGGKTATMLALNKTSGDVIWKSANPEGDNAEYASVMKAEVNGKTEYIQFLRKGVMGVDGQTGKFLWRYTKTIDMGANIITPVVDGSKVFTSGSRSGGGLIDLQDENGAVVAKPIYYNNKLTPSIGGAVLVDGYLYASNSQYVFCADFATGEIKWSNRSVGQASICYADGRIYARGHSTGEVVLLEANPKEYKEVGRFKQPDRSKIQAWPHPVIANGNLYLRDQDVLLCYSVAK